MSGKTAKAIRRKVNQYKKRFLRDEWISALYEPLWRRVKLCFWIMRGKSALKPRVKALKNRAKTLKNT